jgi:EAL domain-containing protein (putative c-di-GMP-specific phosphodiesterase class I)
MSNYLMPGQEFVGPFLEHFPENGEGVHRVTLEPLPFQIGRSTAADYIILSRQVSKRHAEIFRAEEGLRIRDLGSTNGTFVNGRRVRESALADGDIIHFGHKEFRFGLQNPEQVGSTHSCVTDTDPLKSKLPGSMILVSEYLRQLLAERCVNIVFQPIVDLRTGETMGFEALGRGTHSGLSPNPDDLLRLAEKLRLAPQLSRLFRMAALEAAAHLPDTVHLFLNVHPSEIGDDFLVDSLREFRPQSSNLQLVLEVNEETVADAALMRKLRKQLDEAKIGIAYDDFGAGQSRLIALVEVPPDFVKLDMNLIRGIDRDPSRHQLVSALNKVLRTGGIQIIAEGIETAEEAETCLQLGCHFGQGFLFGRPSSITPKPVNEAEELVAEAARSHID